MATDASRPAWDAARGAAARTRLRRPGAFLLLGWRSRCAPSRELGIGFWIDEGLSVGIADRPLGDIPHVLREDGSPPLYYMLLHVWMAIVRRRARRRRTRSRSLFALARDPGRLVGRRGRSSGRARGLDRRLLAAFNPFLTDYAQETRMYSLVAAAGDPRDGPASCAPTSLRDRRVR